MSLPDKTASSYENKEIILLNFIMKMLVWKAQWDVKGQYDKEFNDLSSAKSILRFIVLFIVLSILVKIYLSPRKFYL